MEAIDILNKKLAGAGSKAHAQYTITVRWPASGQQKEMNNTFAMARGHREYPALFTRAIEAGAWCRKTCWAQDRPRSGKHKETGPPGGGPGYTGYCRQSGLKLQAPDTKLPLHVHIVRLGVIDYPLAIIDPHNNAGTVIEAHEVFSTHVVHTLCAAESFCCLNFIALAPAKRCGGQLALLLTALGWNDEPDISAKGPIARALLEKAAQASKSLEYRN